MNSILHNTDSGKTHEMKDSEEKYRAIYENIPEVLYQTDMNGIILEISPSIQYYSDFNPDELVGKPVQNLYYNPDDRAILLDLLIKNGELREYELKLKTITGALRYGSISARLIFDSGGRPGHIDGVIRDITERKNAAEALKLEKQKAETYLNVAQVILVAFDRESKITLLNQKGSQVLGYEPGELEGKDWFKICVPAEDHDSVLEVYQSIISGKIEPYKHHENNIITKNGEKRLVAWHNTWISDIEGKIQGLLSSGEDITQRRQVEEKLRHVARLYALLGQINQAILRNREQDELFRTICQVAIKFGQFRMAWIGLIEEADDNIRPVAHAGWEEGYLKQILITTGELPTGKGPVGTAMREEKIAICYDIANEPQMIPWREEAIKRGYRSLASVPFRRKNKIIGALNLYSSEPGFFTADEQRLLQEIGEDISFALDAMSSETARNQAEVALKESEERYRGFISQVSDGVYRFECDHPMSLSLPLEEQVDYIYDHMFIAECNRAFVKMYGIEDQKEMIGKCHLDFHGGRYNEVNRDLMRKFIKNGYSIENGLTEEINAEGLQIHIRNNILGIIENNHLIRIWGTQIDVTEKMRSEKIQQMLYAISNAALSSHDLQELFDIIKQELGKLIDSTNFYIAFYDETTGMLSTQYIKDEKDQFSTWNAEKSVTGYIIKHQKSLLATNKDIIKLYEAGEIEIVGTPSKVWLGVPFSVNKKAIGAVVVQNYDNPDAFTEKDKLMLEFVSHQISIVIERKKAEQELKDALIKAQESDLFKSAFLANMSHEIRTPMNGILGFAGLLKDPNLTSEEQQTYVSIIETSGARMLNIINDIICISKVESGQMEVSISETNINMQIEYIYTFFSPEVERKGMKIFYKNGLPSNESIVRTDKEKIYAILTNLVKNAIKYSDKGTIEFGYNLVNNPNPVETHDRASYDSASHDSASHDSASHDRASQSSASQSSASQNSASQNSASQLQFYVKDTGIGVPKNKQEAIFDRFVQADIGDERAFQGAGLGLSISKAFVEMLGGLIWLESEEGIGSVFYFTIPYNREPEKIIIPKIVVSSEEPKPKTKDLKILIAEDDEGSARLIGLAVRSFSKNIIKVRTGVDAVEACQNNHDLDLVLMDIKLPLMDGYDATRKIRQFNNEVVIIAQTACALTGDREMALEAGCNDYITKPIKKEKLTLLINKYFA
jgi:PAS domain S-box-containing protein